VSAMTYLWRHQSGVYYFRRAVPEDIRTIIGKTMVKQSLRTTNLVQAKRRAHPLAIQTETDFQSARERRSAPPRTELSEAERSHLVAAYLHYRLAEDEARRIQGSKEDDDLYKSIKAQVEAHGGAGSFTDEDATAPIGLSRRAFEKASEALEIVLPGLREHLARGDTSIVADDVDAFLDMDGINLDRASPAYRRLSYEFLQAAVRATEAASKRHEGQIIETPAAPPPLPTRRAVPSAPDGVDLMTMFNKWVEERKPPTKTALDFETAIRRFVELHGNPVVHEITRAQVRAYKEALQKLPRSCAGKMRQMTMPELLDYLQQHPSDGATLSAGSVNKALGALQTVLRWVEAQGYLEEHPNWSNPAANMKMHNPAKDEDTRLPYDTEELMTIFGSAVFRNGARPQGGAGEAAKWLPLIALFTGARLEEIGQALTSDVKDEDGIPSLDINTLDRRAGKRVKNRSSRRRLPLHSELLRCGLLAYVEERRQAEDERLFPGLRPSITGQMTGNWSKWWSRYTDDLGITDDRKVFHSFRHTFKRACRAARIEEELHDALTGHTSASVGRKYGNGVPLEVLAEAVGRVSYKGLDLTHLHVIEPGRT
jgi:integrase